jgi:hypothetical protein
VRHAVLLLEDASDLRYGSVREAARRLPRARVLERPGEERALAEAILGFLESAAAP